MAEKLEVVVSEQNFRTAGINVKSGFCILKNRKHCIIDKHLRIYRKIEILGECLGLLEHDDIFMVPAVRELLDRYAKKEKNDTSVIQ